MGAKYRDMVKTQVYSKPDQIDRLVRPAVATDYTMLDVYVPKPKDGSVVVLDLNKHIPTPSMLSPAGIDDWRRKHWGTVVPPFMAYRGGRDLLSFWTLNSHPMRAVLTLAQMFGAEYTVAFASKGLGGPAGQYWVDRTGKAHDVDLLVDEQEVWTFSSLLIHGRVLPRETEPLF